jgi:hypothetical protein
MVEPLTSQRAREDAEDGPAWRLTLWCALASVFHFAAAVTLSLWLRDRPSPHSGIIGPAVAVDLLEVTVALRTEPSGERAPGGGSPDPDPLAARAASHHVEAPLRTAPAAVRAPARRDEGPVTAPEAPPEDAPREGQDAEPALIEPAWDAQPELLAPLRPRKVRRMLESRQARAPASAPDVSGAREVLARSEGYGPGAHGGPGGPGSGWGHGGRSKPREHAVNAFGGKKGAFRGEVCAIPPSTTAIRGTKSCARIAELATDHFDISPRRFEHGFPGVRRNEWFAIKYTGSFEVSAAGEYVFRLISDDGALVYIDGVLVMDNDGLHPASGQWVRVRLGAGLHQFRLLYFQGPRFDIALQLYVRPPGQPERLFGPRF